MKMVLPERATSFDFDGDSYKPDKNRVVDIPTRALNQARMHGLKFVGEKDETPESPLKDVIKVDEHDAAKTITELAGENSDLKKQIARLTEQLVAASKKGKR